MNIFFGNNLRNFTKICMFSTIIFILGLTPIGFIQTPAFKIVTVHIPVIIGGLILGAKSGAILGFVFGLTSLINAHINITPTSLFFSPIISGNIISLLICFLPRILTGVMPYFLFSLLKKTNKVFLFFVGAFSSFTNTFLVISLIYIFFKDDYIKLFPGAYVSFLGLIFANVLINSILEAVTAGIITSLVYSPLLKSNKYL